MLHLLFEVRDSHKQVECSASYDYQPKMFGNKYITVNAGFGAGLTSRADIAHRFPIPFIFPTASVQFGSQKVRYNVYLIPKTSGINSGAVLYFYATVPVR